MAVIENLTKLMMFTLVCGSNGEGTPSPPPPLPTSCLLLVIEDEKGFFPFTSVELLHFSNPY